MRSSVRPGAPRPLQADPRSGEIRERKRRVYGPNYIDEEETIRNDYSRHYIASGSRPQNHIQNPAVATRFAEYPRLRRLLDAKEEAVASQAHPPTYLSADLRTFQLQDLLPCRFDVILIDPPLKEYSDLHPDLFPPDSAASKGGGPEGGQRPYWTWDELEALPIPSIAANPGFVLIWCGSGQGPSLEQGRSLLTKWGYRKCEDLVWVKTNRGKLKKGREEGEADREEPPTAAVFTPTKEHCLMGIRGTVRRSTDGHFVHCNVDTDVIIADADELDPTAKPREVYDVIEHFCLGGRRLELFGSKRSIRRGWLTVGLGLDPPVGQQEEEAEEEAVPFERDAYAAHFYDSHDGRANWLVHTTPEIESLRPRSPAPRGGVGTPTHSVGQLPRGLGSPAGGTMLSLSHSSAGRNTVSHPSGGLGRGPGNAYQPGMRLSGVRELGPGSASPSHHHHHRQSSPPLHPPPHHSYGPPRLHQQPPPMMMGGGGYGGYGGYGGGGGGGYPMFTHGYPSAAQTQQQGWMSPQVMSPVMSPQMHGGEWGMLPPTGSFASLSLGQSVGYGADPSFASSMGSPLLGSGYYPAGAYPQHYPPYGLQSPQFQPQFYPYHAPHQDLASAWQQQQHQQHQWTPSPNHHHLAFSSHSSPSPPSPLGGSHQLQQSSSQQQSHHQQQQQQVEAQQQPPHHHQSHDPSYASSTSTAAAVHQQGRFGYLQHPG